MERITKLLATAAAVAVAVLTAVTDVAAAVQTHIPTFKTSDAQGKYGYNSNYYTHRGSNYKDAGGITNRQYLHLLWTTDTMPIFGYEKLVYNTTEPYIDLHKHNFAWASQEPDMCINGGNGLYKNAADEWCSNAWYYQACSSNASLSGAATSAGIYQFGVFPSNYGNSDYGSRYLVTTVFELQENQKYVFSPMFVQGEGGDVNTNVYLAIQGYSATKRGTNNLGTYNSHDTYPQLDSVMSWFNYNGNDSSGKPVLHRFLTAYKNAGTPANTWTYTTATGTKYVTIQMRCASGDTQIGAGADYAFGNSKIPNGGIEDSVKGGGTNMGDYGYAFLCYAPFIYTFRVNGTTVATVERAGVSTIEVPEAAYAAKTGYTVTGLKLTAGGTPLASVSGAAPTIVAGTNGTTKTVSEWNTIFSDAKCYGALFSNATFDTVYTANSYNIAYDLNGGTKKSGGNYPASAKYDTAFSVSAPTRTGYTFTGWKVVSGLNASTAKYGATVSGCTNAIGASTVFKNGTNDVYVKNLTAASGGSVTLQAQWTPNNYGVAYDFSDGVKKSGGNYPTVATFDTVFSVSAPTRTGYGFSGWKIVSGLNPSTAKYGTTASGCTNAIGESTVFTNGINDVYLKNLTALSGATVTLKAQWSPSPYNVLYDLNGGTKKSGGSYPASAVYDTAFSVSAPTKAGYNFTGWKVVSGLNASTAKYGATVSGCTNAIGASTVFTNGTNDVYVKNLTATSGGSVTLQAQWQSAAFNVTLDGNGATSTNHTTSVMATFGQPMPSAVMPTRHYTVTFYPGRGQSTITKSVDYTFKGYFLVRYSVDATVNASGQYYTATGASAKNFDKTSNTTLYAAWNSAGIVLPDIQPTDDYRFDGWWDEPDGGTDADDPDNGTKVGDGGDVYTPEENESVYGHWTYLGTAPDILYYDDVITEMYTEYGWYNYKTTVSKINKKLTAKDADGDMVSFKLYPGSHETGALPEALAEAVLSEHYTTATCPTGADIGNSSST